MAARTDGIQITETWVPGWGSKRSRSDGSIRLNFWDFGGREILQTAHTPFLNKRSLYLLVIDGKGEDNERTLHTWMRIIQCYAGDSPVLVVMNTADASTPVLDEGSFRREYRPNLRGFHRVSCLTGEGIDDLRTAIEFDASRLPHVREVKSLQFFQFRDLLEAALRLTGQLADGEYAQIRKKSDVGDDEAQEFLGLLCDIGVILTRNRPEVLLDSGWVAGGIYAILSSPLLASQQGVVDSVDLEKIFGSSARYPRERLGTLVEVLRDFELCFEMPGSSGGTWVIPELAELNEPDLDWDRRDAINFEYHYRVFPVGLIPRFIVKMHQHLSSDPPFWRGGAVLKFGQCRAVVRSDLRTGRISISVHGPVPDRGAGALPDPGDLGPDERGACEARAQREGPPPRQPRDRGRLRGSPPTRRQERPRLFPPGAARRYSVSKLLKELRFPPRPIVPPEPRPTTLRIARVHLENLRHFNKLDLDFSNGSETCDWVLLLGENGTGKSTVLRAIAAGLCDDSTALRLLSQIPGGLTRLGSSDSAVISVELVSADGKIRYWQTTEISSSGGKISVKRDPNPDEHLDLIFACGYGADQRGFGNSSYEKYQLHDSLCGLFDPGASLQNPELVLRRAGSTASDGENLLRQLTAVLDLKPGSIKLTDTGISVSMSGPEGTFYPLAGLGSGYHATLLWICDFVGWALYFNPLFLSSEVSGIVLFDELEHHLHPRWQREIILQLSRQFPHVQFIATSHSPICAGGLADLDESKCRLFVLKQGKSDTECTRVAIPAGLRYDQIMTSEEFGLPIARDLTTARLLDDLRIAHAAQNPSDDRSPEVNAALKSLSARSLSAAEDERFYLAHLRVQGALERIQEILESRPNTGARSETS